MHADLTPIILAIAALIVAITPGMVGLVVGLSTHDRVGRIETNTNGNLAALRAEVDRLNAQVGGRRDGDGGPRP